MRVSEKNVAIGVGLGVGAVLAGWLAWQRRTTPTFALPHTWEEAGKVSELNIYPVKAARGISVKEAEATSLGLAVNLLEDRSFLVTSEEGHFITSRQVGTMATIETDVKGSVLTLKAKGHKDVTVDLELDLMDKPILKTKVRELMLPGVDCGDAVADWLTRVLYEGETKVRLIYKGDVLKNRPARRPDYFDFKGYRDYDEVLYADYSGYLLTCQSSLDDLNSRLSDKITMERFRPNVVIGGTPAFDEDDWIFVRIGDVVLRRLKPCERCVVTTINPETGERHQGSEPLTTMREYRIIKNHPVLSKKLAVKPIFGITMGIDKPGPIAVGTKVYIARASVHPHLKGF